MATVGARADRVVDVLVGTLPSVFEDAHICRAVRADALESHFGRADHHYGVWIAPRHHSDRIANLRRICRQEVGCAGHSQLVLCKWASVHGRVRRRGTVPSPVALLRVGAGVATAHAAACLIIGRVALGHAAWIHIVTLAHVLGCLVEAQRCSVGHAVAPLVTNFAGEWRPTGCERADGGRALAAAVTRRAAQELRSLEPDVDGRIGRIVNAPAHLAGCWVPEGHLGVSCGIIVEHANRGVRQRIGGIKGGVEDAQACLGGAGDVALRKHGRVVVYDTADPCDIAARLDAQCPPVCEPEGRS
mmetsp:Transcript_22316/g.67881  ORF Transcript_22316/g.67881 Transcript_22316/m.67881 type:complete len:302 (+) Transcript_22316:1023-1928(+)